MIPWVVASETGKAQTMVACCRGVVGPHLESTIKLNHLESWVIAGDNPVSRNLYGRAVPWVRRDRRNPAWICRHHPVRLNTNKIPIVNEYCEGKVKSTPSRGVKRPWNHTLTSGRSGLVPWRRAFCIMTLRVTLPGKIKVLRTGVGAKASLNRALSQGE